MLVALLSLCAILPTKAEAVDRWNIRPFHNSQDLPFQEVRDIVEDKDGAIWIATWGGGVTRIHGTHSQTYDELNGLPSNWVRALEMDSDGNVWVGTAQGLCRYRDGPPFAW